MKKTYFAFFIPSIIFFMVFQKVDFSLKSKTSESFYGKFNIRNIQDSSPVSEMVLVPAGKFQMGDNFNEGDADERPVHTVNLKSFFVGKFEITNGEFINFLRDEFLKNNIIVSGKSVKGKDNLDFYTLNHSEKTISYKDKKFKIDKKFENHPVILVSWYGAVAFCNWRSEKEGFEKCYDADYNLDLQKNGYHLPTEAEWEEAARGTDQRRFPNGKGITGSDANFWNSGDPFQKGNYPFTTPVGLFNGKKYKGFQTTNSVSPYGAYDMAGNVYEWCHDFYSSTYYKYCENKGTVNDPVGPTIGTHRVLRDGSWMSYRPMNLCSANRFYADPAGRNYNVGFRVVRNR